MPCTAFSFYCTHGIGSLTIPFVLVGWLAPTSLTPLTVKDVYEVRKKAGMVILLIPCVQYNENAVYGIHSAKPIISIFLSNWRFYNVKI